MASNINWSVLTGIGSGIDTSSRGVNGTVERLDFDRIRNAANDIGEMFAVSNRRDAIDGIGGKRIQAQKDLISRLESKLDSLRQELVQAKMNDSDYQASQAYALAQNEGIEASRGPSLSQLGAQSMQGYHGNGMANYNPNIQVRF